MQKITKDLYCHRGIFIIRDEQGIWYDGCLHLFKTFNDARAHIDKTHSGCHKKEPVIVGEWKIPNQNPGAQG